MKKLLLIGASGFVGSSILREALNRDIYVKAIVRNPEKIDFKHDNMDVVASDVLIEDNIAGLASGYDTVISAYNPGWENPDIYDENLKGYSSIINGIKRAGVRRLLVVGGAGSLLVSPDTMVMDTGALPDAILPGVKSLYRVYTDYLLNEREIDWVFFSPAGQIFPGERTGKYRLGKDKLIIDENGESKISVEDYAAAMVDECLTPKHHFERFTIGY